LSLQAWFRRAVLFVVRVATSVSLVVLLLWQPGIRITEVLRIFGVPQVFCSDRVYVLPVLYFFARCLKIFLRQSKAVSALCLHIKKGQKSGRLEYRQYGWNRAPADERGSVSRYVISRIYGGATNFKRLPPDTPSLKKRGEIEQRNPFLSKRGGIEQRNPFLSKRGGIEQRNPPFWVKRRNWTEDPLFE